MSDDFDHGALRMEYDPEQWPDGCLGAEITVVCRPDDGPLIVVATPHPVDPSDDYDAIDGGELEPPDEPSHVFDLVDGLPRGTRLVFFHGFGGDPDAPFVPLRMPGAYRETTTHYDAVRRFMGKAGQGCPGRPTVPDDATLELRARLLLEETLETIRALGCRVYTLDAPAARPCRLSVERDVAAEPDLVEIMDGCADVAVVATGTLVACGVPDAELAAMVDDNNLAKFGPGHSIRADGKVEKPADHKPPAIAELLRDLDLAALSGGRPTDCDHSDKGAFS